VLLVNFTRLYIHESRIIYSTVHVQSPSITVQFVELGTVGNISDHVPRERERYHRAAERALLSVRFVGASQRTLAWTRALVRHLQRSPLHIVNLCTKKKRKNIEG
jgi:hypothetical protein